VLATLEAVSYVRTGKAGTWTDHRVLQGLGVLLIVLLLVVWGARAFGAFGGPAPVLE
jgi:hypothetical protein